MAFIGSDGLEHQLKHLKAQLAHKGELKRAVIPSRFGLLFPWTRSLMADQQLGTVQNEYKKQTEELNALRRSRQAANHDVSWTTVFRRGLGLTSS